jgi:hypothetical protein
MSGLGLGPTQDTRDSFSGIKWQDLKLATRFRLLQIPRASGTVLLPQLRACTVSTAATLPAPFISGAVVVAVLKDGEGP